MADNSVFLIDIDKVLKEKAPDKAKLSTLCIKTN